MRTETFGGMSLVLAAAASAWLAGCSTQARATSEAPPSAQPAAQSAPDSAPAASRPDASPSAAPATATTTAGGTTAGGMTAGGSTAGPTTAEPTTAEPAAADSSYLQYDAATKTVTFRLEAGPFTFNGFGNGGGTLTVPPGSTNVWNFVQNDGTPHSAEIAAGTGPLPNSGGDPAIPRAYTNKVVEGLVQGGTDVLKFTAPDTGTYRIICGVPGHALSGMWIWFKVDPAATAPTFGPTPK